MQDFLSDLLKQQHPFVLFRFPQQKKVHCYFQLENDTYWTTNFEEEGFVFAPFKKQQKQLMIPATHQRTFTLEVPETNKDLPTLPPEAKQSFIKTVQNAVDNISTTSLEKVVLSNAFDLPYTGEGSTVYQRMVNRYENAFVYYWYHPATGEWLGASPERLITLENGHLSTVALAGTLPSNNKASEWTSKEIHEQAVVVEAIVDGLTQSGAAQEITVGERSTIKAGALYHLQTLITAKVAAAKLLPLVNYLHPTPAVGGLPKTLALDFILAQESYQRAFYTGYLGPFAQGKTAHFYVNLRCGQLSQNELRIYTGAGITAGSIPEKEWEEICRKASTFLSVL